MKIVITGGNGYLGARLSSFLADNGEQVIPLCFPSIPTDRVWLQKMYEILDGDIREQRTITKVAELNPDAVIHLISLDHFNSENEPGIVNEVNVLPTWRLLDACTKTGLRTFLYFSTAQVYGKLPDTFIDETHQVNTLNTYGLTHLLSEQICDHYNRKTRTNVTSVRLSNSYGEPIFSENNCWWLVINDLCKTAYLNREIKMQSDGSPQRDFIHGNDVCQAVYKIIQNAAKRETNNIYHISSGVTLTILEIAQLVKAEYQARYNQELPIFAKNHLINNYEPIQTERFQISNFKIRELGFIPEYNIKSGIRNLFDYLEKNYVRGN